MNQPFEFAISLGQLHSAAAYLDSSKEPQQLIAPADGSSWLANDVLLEPDCVAAEFSRDAEYVDFNAYVGDADSHMLALSDFPNRAIHAIPLQDRKGFGTLSRGADEVDFDVMVELVRETELKKKGLPAEFETVGRQDTARLLHLAILLRAYRSIARRTLLRPCSSAVIAIPRYLWGAASVAAEIAGIEHYFLVDPNVASIAARHHEDARKKGAVSQPLDLEMMTDRTTLVMEMKYNSLAVSTYRRDAAGTWNARQLWLSGESCDASSHPDEIGDVRSPLLGIARQEIRHALGEDEDVEVNLYSVLRRIRGRIEGGAHTKPPRYIAVLGNERHGLLDVEGILRKAFKEGYSKSLLFHRALKDAQLESGDIQEIVLTGPLRSVSTGSTFSPANMVSEWLSKSAPELFERTKHSHAQQIAFKVGGAPSLGGAVLSRLAATDLDKALAPDLGISHCTAAESGRNEVVTGRPCNEVIEIVTAMMKAVGEVHFSKDGR